LAESAPGSAQAEAFAQAIAESLTSSGPKYDVCSEALALAKAETGCDSIATALAEA